MELRAFGDTRLSVSEFGLGCARIGGIFQQDTSEFLRLLSAARDAGITFFDTADMYSQGESEALIGRAFQGKRGSVIIAATQKTAEISLPVAITVFPEDVYRPPETWSRRAYRNLTYFNEVDKGGHFAAWEQPELFSQEIRAAFRALR